MRQHMQQQSAPAAPVAVAVAVAVPAGQHGAAPPQAAAVQLMQSAYVDPSDPTKLYVQTP